MAKGLIYIINYREAWWCSRILQVDDNLLISKDVGLLSLVKIWFSTQFQMKDLGEAYYILGIKVLRDHKNRKLVLSQAIYIDKLLAKYVMQDSKKGLLSFRHGIPFLRISVLKHPRRKNACSKYPMPLQWVLLCMQCYILGHIFALKWVW